MARKFNSNINSANVFEVFSAADDKGAQLKLLGGLTVKELRAIAKDLRIKITSGRRRKFDIVVTIAEAVLNYRGRKTYNPLETLASRGLCIGGKGR